MNYLEQTLAQLACDIPGATRVFHQHKLDFCCGGKVALAEAIVGRNVTAEQISAELAAVVPLPDDERDWRLASRSELIDHLLARYHEVHRVQLPELIRLAKRVEHVHGERQDCPKGLSVHLSLMLDELELHMQKEEQILFPLLRDGLLAQAAGPISVMQREHEEHGDNLETMARLTDDNRIDMTLSNPAGLRATSSGQAPSSCEFGAVSQSCTFFHEWKATKAA